METIRAPENWECILICCVRSNVLEPHQGPLQEIPILILERKLRYCCSFGDCTFRVVLTTAVAEIVDL